ncbi:MAG: hypothetical protein Ct9H300mP1_33440 [Planctomycetaceae bacterium]|nr:MAG: hypothetical protein Ct9H300mP1_33440 [Planctomycetaceae bacterium]
MHGGPSHVDLLDPKPMLSRYHGTLHRPKSTTTRTGRSTCWAARSRFVAMGRGTGVLGGDVRGGESRRRHRRDPLKVHRTPQPRAGHLDGQHRPDSPRTPEHRQLGSLRTGIRNRRSAGLHRSAGPGRTSRRRGPQLVQWLVAPIYQGTAFRSQGVPVLHLNHPRPVRRPSARGGSDFSRRSIANICGPAPANWNSRPGSPTSNSPLACSFRPPTHSISRVKPRPLTRCTGSTIRRPSPTAAAA